MCVHRFRSTLIRSGSLLAIAAGLAGCQPPEPGTPRSTAPIILEITPAPTFDIDATATSYAQQMVASPTPAGLYIVQPGDTLSGLAQDFGTTVEDIMAANGITDPDALQVGQALIIPSLVSRPINTASPVSPTVPPTATAVPPTATRVPTRRPAPTATPAPPTEVPAPPPPTEAPGPPPPTEVPSDATPTPMP
jgi:LysM repeat protein